MAGIKIPGAESIETINPARDPGIKASPDAFGAQIGDAGERFGSAEIASASAQSNLGAGMVKMADALGSLSAHLYQKLQNSTADTWVQTHNIDSAVATQQAIYDNRAAFPSGDPDGGTAASDDMRQRLQVAQDKVTASTTAKLGTPTDAAMSRVNATFAGRAVDALTQQTAFGHNQQVVGKQTALNDNVATLGSQVLSGAMPLDKALESVDAQAEAGKPLWGASQLVDQKEKWQHAVIDAAIKQKYSSGDRAGGDAIADKYYGAVPRSGDSNAAKAQAAMDYFQSTGKTKEQAAGIVGNLIHESNLNTRASGDAGTAFGIAQWRGERQVELRAFARAKGKSPDDFQTQLEFINQELNTSESAAHQRLLGAKTTQDATMAFVDYERPQGVGTANPLGWSNRLGQANALANGKAIGNVTVASADGGAAGVQGQGQSVGDDDNEVSSTASGGVAPILPNVEKSLYWRQQSKAVGVDLDRQEKIKARQDLAASKQAEGDYLKDIFSDNPKTTVQGIMNDDRLNIPAKLQLRAVAERQFKDDPLAKVSQQSSMGLITRMRLPEGDPNKVTNTAPIFKEYTDGKMTRPDFEFALKMFNENIGPDGGNVNKQKASFIKNAGDAIGLANLGSSLTGGGGTFQRYNFEQYVAAKEQAYRAEGKNPANLFDPAHTDYLGKLDKTGRPAILAPFLTNAQQEARDEAAGIKPATPTVADTAANRIKLDEWVRQRGGFPVSVTAPPTPVVSQ